MTQHDGTQQGVAHEGGSQRHFQSFMKPTPCRCTSHAQNKPFKCVVPMQAISHFLNTPRTLKVKSPKFATAPPFPPLGLKLSKKVPLRVN